MKKRFKKVVVPSVQSANDIIFGQRINVVGKEILIEEGTVPFAKEAVFPEKKKPLPKKPK